MSLSIDSAPRLPYVVVPEALRTEYGFLDTCALYYCAQVEHFVVSTGDGGDREPAVLFITCDSLYIGDNQGGIYRRVELKNICCILTNIGFSLSDNPSSSRSLFTAFVLSNPQEPSDIVLAGKTGYAAAVVAERLLSLCGHPVPMQRCMTDRHDLLPEGVVRLPPRGKPTLTLQEQQALRDSISSRSGAANAAFLSSANTFGDRLGATLARLVDEKRSRTTAPDTVVADAVPPDVWVPVAIRRCFPPFNDVSLFWGGSVRFYGKTLKEFSEATLFITPAQVVVVHAQQPVRVLPLQAISKVLVHSIDSVRKQRFTFFVSSLKDADICIQTVGKDSDLLLKRVQNALCALDPTHVPPINPVATTKGLKLRLRPKKGYKLPTIAMPPTSENARYRNFVFERVRDILRACEPLKQDTAAALTEQFLGRELELLSLLYNTYPEYAMRQEFSSVPEHRERLLLFCAKYLPDSVGIVDDVLNSYKGREEELFHHLVMRYGPEPREKTVGLERYKTTLSPEEIRRTLVNFYRHYEPKKIADVDAIMALYQDREQLLFERLTQLYGPMPLDQDSSALSVQPNLLLSPRDASHVSSSPPLPNEDETADRPSWRQRLEAFLARYIPERTGDADMLLQKYAGQEDALLCGLEKKYGPEPVPVTRRNRARVSAFFVRAGLPEPDEAQIDETIRSFHGSEEDFFLYLEQRYGAESPLQFPREAEEITAVEFAKVDLRTEVPFVEVPESLQCLFPSFRGRAALFWFGRVLHWEQPAPPTLRCAYLTSSHIYVGNSEADTVRCTALERVEAVYMNSKRERRDMPLSMIMCVHEEHDLFFAFASDEEGHQLLSVLTSTLTQYHFGRQCRVFACANFTDFGIHVNCARPPTYINHVVAVLQRPRTNASLRVGQKNNEAASSGIDGDDIHVHRLLKQKECELRSGLHDALILKDDGYQNVELQRDAVLVNQRWATIRQLATKERKMFGTVPPRPSAGSVIVSNARSTMNRTNSPPHSFQAVANVPSHIIKANPLQRAQYGRFSPNGTYGLGVKARLYGGIEGAVKNVSEASEGNFTRLLMYSNERSAAGSVHNASYRPSITRGDGGPDE
ncbi:hypothetical protein C3747_176g27 [Trypanosoma cruzi]|uniref:Uncharacterized protein n=2 Tax=Trypanosoma cruzi TaxID=5693 RepID=Q4DEP3_TRYCC|nr:hypothetical protein Tc00.1047053510819.30 [Trypanosoma cruzi]EAN90990.1 hypothetical protein Tc00.1047053510819.30 [Trypanosoma cruzi]PWV03536.1 hypothetical protein C3747_176g27 [Trypanosoma cruzi]|eukprot:XP_812841.1 hypothetical protein [Trypanosoma cruzi strain CL Brener]